MKVRVIDSPGYRDFTAKAVELIKNVADGSRLWAVLVDGDYSVHADQHIFPVEGALMKSVTQITRPVA